jgi:hypothetical protein
MCTSIIKLYLSVIFSAQLPPESPKRGAMREYMDNVSASLSPSFRQSADRFSPPNDSSPLKGDSPSKTASLPRHIVLYGSKPSGFPQSLAVSGRLEVRSVAFVLVTFDVSISTALVQK